MITDKKFDPCEYLKTSKRAPLVDALDWLPRPLHDFFAVSVVLIYFFVDRILTLLLELSVLLWKKLGIYDFFRKHRFKSYFVSIGIILITGYVQNTIALSKMECMLADVLNLLALGPLSIAVGTVAKRVKKVTLGVKLELWFSARLRNPADIKQLERLIANSVVLAPAWLTILWPTTWTIFSVSAFLIVLGRMGSSQETLIHSDIHNHIFRYKHLHEQKEKLIFYLLNSYLQYVIPLLSCRAPYRYSIDHAMMHHVEDNGVFDVQSTIWYDRKSFIEFCRFALRRGVDSITWIDSYRYFAIRNMSKPVRILLHSQCVWYLFVLTILTCNPYGAALIAIIPLIGGAPLAITVFFWHGLVDTKNTENVYTNTINIAAGSAGIHAWHLEHHLHPANHWSTQKMDSENDISNYERESSIIYLAHDHMRYLFLKAMWTRQFHKLAYLCVPTCDLQRDPAKLASLIEERTASVSDVTHGTLFTKIDAFLGRMVSAFLLPGQFPKDPVTGRNGPEVASTI